MSGRASHFGVIRVLLVVSVVLALAGSAAAQDPLAQMRAQYVEETKPVDKAKVLAKLGSREMNAIRDLVKAGDDEQALAALQQYRNWVRDTTQALVSSGIDAQRHSGGFKELQISLRMFLRRLDDLLFTLQQDTRTAFRAVRTDLEADEGLLIDALFPPRTPRPPESASSN